MRPKARTLAVLAAGASLVAFGARAGPPGAREVDPAVGAARVAHEPREAEVARIKSHFDTVLAELRHAPIDRLTPGQRARRAERIAELEAYRDRGEFPHNHDFADRRVPYFVDHRGVLCAVAHLLDQSGRRDIVDRVAAANNFVRVPELANDTELVRWLDENGLTVAEAARIQPTYAPQPTENEPSDLNTAGAVFASGMGVATTAFNLLTDDSRGRTARGAIGLTVGVLGLAIAGSRMDLEGDDFRLGVATGVIGLASSAVGLHELLGARSAPPRADDLEAAREPVSVSLTPAIDPRQHRMAAGLSLTVRF